MGSDAPPAPGRGARSWRTLAWGGAACGALACLAPCAARLAAQTPSPAQSDTAPRDTTPGAPRDSAPPVERVPADGNGGATPSGGGGGWTQWLGRLGREWRERGRGRDGRTDAARADSVRVDATGVPSARGDTVPHPSRMPVRCAGQPVTDVVVLTQPPYANGLLGRLGFVERTVRELHATTRDEVVRRFLLLAPGDACDELRRAESERILRAQPYLVDARITPYPNAQGGVLLEVETRDEFSAIVSANVRTASMPVSRLRIGEANLMGLGMYTVARWYDGGPGYRDGFGGRMTQYQFLGRPLQLTVEGERRDVGSWWKADVGRPYLTDLQRVAWRANAGGAMEYLKLRRPGAQRNALFFERQWAEVGGVVRLGVPGRLSLFGISLSSERATTADDVVILSDSGVVADSGPPLGFRPAARYPGQHTARVNMLWGIRNVRFMRVTGFDALTGAQDIRRGFQLGTLVGRGVGFLGTRDDDLFLGAGLYVGAGGTKSFAALEATGEGRQDFDARRWDGIVAGGRFAWYLVPNAWQRFVASVEYAGGWRPRVPMQLHLGINEGGVRGFGQTSITGAQRLVARVEQRWVLGRPFNVGDAGLATFVDAGRTWAGDAPYGVTSPIRASVGLGLLGAFPPRSRRLWRMDLALPVTREPGARFAMVFTNRDLTRTFWREPGDAHMARERAIPVSVFNWPAAR